MSLDHERAGLLNAVLLGLALLLGSPLGFHGRLQQSDLDLQQQQ